MSRFFISLAALLCMLFNSCLEMPAGVQPVSGFELKRYLGKWYEIARFDHSFERGLDSVTAEYSMRQDGGVKVFNRGYNCVKSKWQDAEGRGYFVGSADVGHFKVSFFGPFYGAYVIWKLDGDYQYAFVTSGKDYLWLLARTPTVSAELQARFLQQAQALGYDTSRLIWVKQ